MILYSRMCNVCNACNALSIFLGKCICFQEKLRTRNSAKYRPPGNLIEAIATQQLSEATMAGNRTEIVSPANEQYENRSKLLRYHYKRAARRAAAKRQSSEQCERYKQCSNEYKPVYLFQDKTIFINTACVLHTCAISVHPVYPWRRVRGCGKIVANCGKSCNFSKKSLQFCKKRTFFRIC